MKMARASTEEINAAIDLAKLTESVCCPHNFCNREFPDDDGNGRPFDEDNHDDLLEFYNRVKALSPGLMRVAFGYAVLVDNACDPTKETLEWKPGIIVPGE